MFDVKKMTWEYHPGQDRLRMLAEDANRQQLVVWMTARLAKGLAVHFLQQLSRREEVATELPQVRQQCQVWDQEVALRKKSREYR